MGKQMRLDFVSDLCEFFSDSIQIGFFGIDEQVLDAFGEIFHSLSPPNFSQPRK